MNIERNNLSSNIKEGDILKSINRKYSLEKEETTNERNRIKNKMDDMWNYKSLIIWRKKIK